MKKLDASRIRESAGIARAEQLVLLDTVDSTNLLAKRLASAGALHGTAILAETQTAGRGRMGRSFLSPQGGIYLSVILRPEASAEELLPLTALLAVAACDAVEEVCALRPRVKWLNDLVWDRKKLAGILAEISLTPDGAVDYVICGIGINCSAPGDAFSPEVQAIATDLLTATGKEPDRSALAGRLIRSFLRACDLQEKAVRMAQYRKDCITLGQQVRIVRGEETFTATADGVDEDGTLWVTADTGERRRVLSGEVSVRGMYGYL